MVQAPKDGQQDWRSGGMCASSQEGRLPESGFGPRLGTFYIKIPKFLLVLFSYLTK